MPGEIHLKLKILTVACLWPSRCAQLYRFKMAPGYPGIHGLYDHGKRDTRRGLCTEHVEALLVQALWRFHQQSSCCLSAIQAAFEQTRGEMGRVFGWVPFYYSPCGRRDEPSRSSNQVVGIGVVGRAGLRGVLLRFASRGNTAYRKWLCRWSRNATHHKSFANSWWRRFFSRQVLLGCRDKSTLPGWLDSSSSLHSTRTCSPQAPWREPRLYHSQTSRQRQNLLELV